MIIFAVVHVHTGSVSVLLFISPQLQVPKRELDTYTDRISQIYILI